MTHLGYRIGWNEYKDSSGAVMTLRQLPQSYHFSPKVTIKARSSCVTFIPSSFSFHFPKLLLSSQGAIAHQLLMLSCSLEECAPVWVITFCQPKLSLRFTWGRHFSLISLLNCCIVFLRPSKYYIHAKVIEPWKQPTPLKGEQGKIKTN